MITGEQLKAKSLARYGMAASRDSMICTVVVHKPISRNPNANSRKIMKIHKLFWIGALLASAAPSLGEEVLRELRVGRAGHAFDHLGNIGGQAETAAASGATIIYATGLGGFGYTGLPPADELANEQKQVAKYNSNAKAAGIKLSIGYLCATSIVRLDTFDKNWTPDLRAQFKTPAAEWRQQDRQGKPLASWYGGDYAPACMNNPDWQAYQRAMVRAQLEVGHDGIFFDNPTVHPQGCYCPHCMKQFAHFLADHAAKPIAPEPAGDVEAARRLADAEPEYFKQFRSTIARDFLVAIREYARTINPRALITCNNSLNSPGVLHSQCRHYGYSIDELSKAEDFVVVEDMGTQPRTEADGQTVEYGPTYKQLHAISHGKPLVAVTLAGADYHTAPNLTRLAMAEAAAHGASYLSWPTWPVEQRERMAKAVRPLADFLRRNEALLNDATPRADVVLFLPMQRWVKTDVCAASTLAAALTAANVQYLVVSEEGLASSLAAKDRPVLVVESMAILSPEQQRTVDAYEKGGARLVVADEQDWLAKVQAAFKAPSLRIEGPSTVRAVVRDQPERTIVHLYNLNLQRISSFKDKVEPAESLKLEVSVPFKASSVTLQTADDNKTAGKLAFKTTGDEAKEVVTISVPRLDIGAIITIDN